MSAQGYHGKLKICFGTTGKELGPRIISMIDAPDARVTLQTKQFADGELCVDYDESIRGADLFIIQSISRPNVNAALMELLLAIDAAKRASVERVTAVIPYYGYARQDRKARMRQPISAKVVADMLSAAGVDHVVALDIHTQQIQGFFSAKTPLDFVPGDLVFLPRLCELWKESPFIVASTDAGGAARCRELASKFDTDIAILDKRRSGDNQSEVMNVIGDVVGKTVVLYDDICDTAGSLVGAASAILKAGAKEVYGCVTHPVLSGPAVERIAGSNFKKLFFSDSIAVSQEQLDRMGKVEIISCAELLKNIVSFIHYEQSYGEYIAHLKEQIHKQCQK